jgi:hypothetical protein
MRQRALTGGHGKGPPGGGGKPAERPRLPVPVEKVRLGGRSRQPAQPGTAFPNPNEPPGIRVGERPQHHGIHDGKDGRGGADAKRQHQDRRCREAGVLPQRTASVAKILQELIEPSDGVHPVDLLAHQGETAELPPGRRSRLVGRHPGADVPIGEQLGMCLELERRLIVEDATPQCRTETGAQQEQS